MNEFIGNNMQVLLMAGSVLLGLAIALTGIHRYDAEDGERSTAGSLGVKRVLIPILPVQ